MTPAFPVRRRAEQFNALVERRSTAEASAPADLAELVALTAALREAPPVQPRPDFAADLRERLLAAAPEAMAAGAVADRLTVHRNSPTTRTRHERRVGAAIAAFALVGASGATAMASEGALPGDTLYPIKRLVEDVRVEVPVGDSSKAARLLAQAETRLAEVNELTLRGAVSKAPEIEDTLGDFSSQATQASDLLLEEYADSGDEAAIEQLRTFAADGIIRLSDLEDALPEDVHDALAHAVQTLFDIDTAAAQLCPACTDAGITELPGNLVHLVAGALGSTGGALGGTSGVPASEPAAGDGPVGVVPTAKPGALATAGVAQPQPGTAPQPGSGPVTGQLPKPSPAPTSAGGVVGGVTGGLGGTLEGVGGAVDGDLGGVVDGVGGTVEDLGEGLGTTVDGVTGGLLGGLTGTQTP